jgi:hypothetical protein
MMFGREAAVHDATKTDRSWMDRMTLECEGWAVLCCVVMCAVLGCVHVSPLPTHWPFARNFNGLSPHIVFSSTNFENFGKQTLPP